MRKTSCPQSGCGPKMIVTSQQLLARRWMFLPQFRCRWPVTTSVATLHSSRVPAGSGGSVSEATGDDNSGHFDMVGPPDLVSNIRPLRLREPTSADEKELQKVKFQMWALKHHFWTQHNTEFKQDKADFAEAVLQRKRASGELTDDVSQVTSEELSIFYKDFLDKKYNDQMTFTRNWMRLNLLLTWTQFKYSIKTLFKFTR